MKIGTELDELVAMMVMGENKPTIDHGDVHLTHIPESEKGYWQCFNIYDHGDKCEWFPLPFSTDLNATKLVINKITERFKHIHISYGGENKWLVSFYIINGANDLTLISASASTIGEAVCKAAIQVKWGFFDVVIS